MITSIFIIVIVIISIYGFYNKKIYSGLIFNPDKKIQLYRYITYAFIHKNYVHLIVNIFTLSIFGFIAEAFFLSEVLFLKFILLSIVFSALPYSKKKNNLLGFSGATSAIIFFCILHYPVIFWISVPYLIFCWYMDKYSNDEIAHASHLWGSLFSVVFIAIVDFNLFFNIFVP